MILAADQVQMPLRAASPPLTIAIRPMHHDDHGFVRATWREGMKDAPAYDRMPWPMYKATVGKIVADIVNDDATKLIGAYVPDGRCAGWLALTPGRSISTVHWIYTRHELDGEKLRHRGIMTMLIEAAQLGRRFAFTFRGPRRRSHRGGGPDRPSRGPSMDEILGTWLQGRGVTAVHVPIQEWLR